MSLQVFVKDGVDMGSVCYLCVQSALSWRRCVRSSWCAAVRTSASCATWQPATCPEACTSRPCSACSDSPCCHQVRTLHTARIAVTRCVMRVFDDVQVPMKLAVGSSGCCVLILLLTSCDAVCPLGLGACR